MMKSVRKVHSEVVKCKPKDLKAEKVGAFAQINLHVDQIYTIVEGKSQIQNIAGFKILGVDTLRMIFLACIF